MKLKKISKDSFKTSKWSGGTTTELYIYPENGSYAERKFEVRISSATVDDDKSVFTRLDGIYRSLMLLDGKMILDINGNKTKLNQYEHIEFSGTDDTKSIGQATDFNIMSRKKGCTIEKIMLPFEYMADDGLTFIYCRDCAVLVTANGEKINAEKGDLIVSDSGLIKAEGDTFVLVAHTSV